ncbi:MAG: hypothetical protein R6V19_08945 [Armatimonadota bacterium]
MIFSSEKNEDGHWRRVELSLYRRCRQGNPEALRTLFYRLGAYWYTAAMMACDSEEQAAGALVRTWSKLLRRLRYWRVGGKLDRRADSLLVSVLRDNTDPATARDALQRSREMDAEALMPVPESLVERAVAASDEAAEAIHRAAVTRTKVERAVAWTVSVVVLIALMFTGWTVRVTNSVANMEIVWEAVQKRVVERDMTGTVRDAMTEMAVSSAVSSEHEKTLDKAGLLLEEIAHAQKQASARMMRYLSERSRADNVSEGLQRVAQEYPSSFQRELMRVALVLEEVENW